MHWLFGNEVGDNIGHKKIFSSVGFPYYFDAAWVDVFPTLYKGGTLVLFNKLMSANQLLKALSDNKITMTCMPSTMIKLITSKYASLDNYDLCNLQLLWYGTEACPVKHVRYLHNKYPHIKIGRAHV